MNGCMNIDRLHERVDRLHEGVIKACMNTLRPGGQDSYGSAAMARSSAVRDAKYLSHVTHI